MRIKRVKMLLFVVIFGGCIEGNKITEHKAMSYAQFSRDVGADDFDPIGAEQIYYRRDFALDAYDIWWRADITPEGWLAVISQLKLSDSVNNYSEKQSSTTPFSQLVQGSPDPEISFPEWWKLTSVSEDARDIVVNDKGRGFGWVCFYSKEESSMLVWRWTRQHWKWKA